MRFSISNTRLSDNPISEDELVQIVEDCRKLVQAASINVDNGTKRTA